jgi:hypothetical protein
MKHSKKTPDGATERIAVLRPVFPESNDFSQKDRLASEPMTC